MKILRHLLPGIFLLLGVISVSAILPAPTAQAQLFGRVKARPSRTAGIWEIVNSTNSMMIVKYAVATRGTSNWRTHKAYIQANSTRMLGYDLKTYDLKLVQVDKGDY